MKIDKYKSFYMDIAIRAAQESVAIRNKVGCVIVTENGSMFSGWNGTPEGWETNECEDEYGVWGATPRETYLETKPEVLHAERNALNKMLSEGVSSKGATVFITLSPCIECALSLIGAKVSRVIYKDDYRCTKGLDLLKRSDTLVEKYVDTY